jgi:hypothetical protein
MTTFDRVAWYCSWLAPAGWIIALLAFLLSVGVGRQALLTLAAQDSLPALALLGASVGLVAHTILGYHVLKSPVFSSEERQDLWRNYMVGLGYHRWRRIMRGHQA